MPFNTRSCFWVADLQRDLRHAARLLRRNPLVTATAVLSLAIGIGANTTVFTVTSALLLQPPRGVAEPSRLVDIGSTRHGSGFGPSRYPITSTSSGERPLSRAYAYSRFPQRMSVTRDGTGEDAESIFGNVVTVNYFSALGAVPAVGRLFGIADSDEPGASPVVVLGHRFWSRRFNSDPAIVGRPLTLNGHLFTVMGVASEGFHGTGIREVDVWVPLGMVAAINAQAPHQPTDRGARWLLIGARLKPGVSISRAAVESVVLGNALEREYIEQNRDIGLAVVGSSPVPGNDGPLVAFLALIAGSSRLC